MKDIIQVHVNIVKRIKVNSYYFDLKDEGFWDTLIKVFKWEDSDTDKSANRI